MNMIDKQTVKKVAEIARLNLTEKEIEKFSKDLSNILGAFEDLKKVDTEKIEPTFQPVEVKNVVREDKIEESFSTGTALAQTKNTEGKHFKGPKVV